MDGRLSGLWVYPVKSMRGQALEAASVDARGFVGDRLYAVRDNAGKFGSGKNTRRFARMDGLALWSARRNGGTVEVRPPDGDWLDALDAIVAGLLTAQVGRPVEIAREDAISHFDAGPLHLVTSGDLDALEGLTGVRSPCEIFRPNMLIETPARSVDLIGRRARIGETEIQIVAPTERCLMVNVTPEGRNGPDVLRVLARETDACFGVYATVARQGRVALGDWLSVIE